MKVTHFGLKIGDDYLYLSKMLLVPRLTKNLISIQKITLDFHLDFCIKNLQNMRMVLTGTSIGGLRQIKINNDVKVAYTAKLWHNHLCHPS